MCKWTSQILQPTREDKPLRFVFLFITKNAQMVSFI